MLKMRYNKNMKTYSCIDDFTFQSKKGVVYAASRSITAKHGFSTRKGGVSALAHTAWLNLALGRGDDEATVKENLRLFCEAIGADPSTVVSAHQIHSSRVLTVSAQDAGTSDRQADGFVTAQAGVTLCVKVADCVPILFCDSTHHVIGACHAGWRGTAAGIAPVTVGRMLSLGAGRESIRVAIGACIHPCCYQVGEDFVREVAALRGKSFAQRYITAKNGGLWADLPAMNVALLQDAGIAEEQISVCDRCTCCRPDLFFSHRATGGLRGTMAAMICL